MGVGEQSRVDFFISYTRADAQWAEGIAWQLEADRLGVCLGPWTAVRPSPAGSRPD
jgi:hypothetical protein